MRGVGGGDHGGEPVGFDADEFVGGDGFDLGDDEVRALLLDERAQRLGVGHVDDVGAVRDLLRRRVGVAVDDDGLDAEALQFDDDFLAELAAAEKHDAESGGRKRRADAGLVMGAFKHLNRSHSRHADRRRPRRQRRC